MGNCVSAPPEVKYDAKEHSCTVNPPARGESTCEECPHLSELDSNAKCTHQDKPAQAPDDPAQYPAKGLPHNVGALGPPLPACEPSRLATVRALSPSLDLEAPPDPEVESILKLCQSIFQCPNTLVALFDDKRVFIREATGAFSRGDFPWRYSFCGWTMASSCHQIMVVPNALEDSRFENNKFVKELGVRFYCGSPLISSQGHRLGTLCFADFKPRADFDACQGMILNNLAEMVVRQIEKDMLLQLRKHSNEEADKIHSQLKRAADCVEDCVALVDVSQPGWRIMYVNAVWDKIMGCSRTRATNALLQDTLQLSAHSQGRKAGPQGRGLLLPQPEHEEAVKVGKELVVTGAVLVDADSAYNSGALTTDRNSSAVSGHDKCSTGRRVDLTFRQASKGAFQAGKLKPGASVGVPSFVPSRASDAPETGHLYFMLVVPAQNKPSQRFSASLPRALSFHADRLDPDSSGLWDSAGANSWSTSIKGLELGALVGSGSFGTVYAADWFGSKVAVKVINEEVKVNDDGASLEAALGAELRHPHIVSILKVVVRRPNSVATNTVSSCRQTLSKSSLQDRPQTLDMDHRSQKLKKLTASQESLNQQQQLQEQRREQQQDEQRRWEQLQQQQQERRLEQLRLGSKATGVGQQGFEGSTEGVEPWPLLEGPVNADGIEGHSSSGNFNLWGCMMSQPGESGQHVPTVPSQAWLIMEFCDKGCVQDAVDRGWLRTGHPDGQPKMGAIIATAFEVASALMYLHKRGIVHGDLSPYNVLLTTSGPRTTEGNRGFVAKVSDFGLARALNIASRITTKTYGTLTHQPPETLVEGTISRATDIYALGVLLWAMYTGSRPWAGLSHAQIVGNVAGKREHLRMPPDMPLAHEPYAQLTMSCLSYEANQRPNTEGVIAALEAMANGPMCQ
uniref:Protein kinase domain-containing protein n=1 Tax=Dunaliella tertiolecta TaxID=3047 RepID=A0A7S3VRN2_DUNTE|mmetsp:Transcript_3862/g.10491  ORF Transcript_3862/g.10491 Transcript_3862/m.10491 type:complete len:909 (+) Transcript_3862:99-2825(+)